MNKVMSDKEKTGSWFNDEGKLHREDGPARIDSLGARYWYLNDQLHRENGPAIEWEDGDKWWYLNNKKIHCNSQEEFERLLKLELFW